MPHTSYPRARRTAPAGPRASTATVYESALQILHGSVSIDRRGEPQAPQVPNPHHSAAGARELRCLQGKHGAKGKRPVRGKISPRHICEIQQLTRAMKRCSKCGKTG